VNYQLSEQPFATLWSLQISLNPAKALGFATKLSDLAGQLAIS
jgi:hypothetical protein